jgi:hypothetical protein
MTVFWIIVGAIAGIVIFILGSLLGAFLTNRAAAMCGWLESGNCIYSVTKTGDIDDD